MSDSGLQRDTVYPRSCDDAPCRHSDGCAGVVCGPNPVKIRTPVRYRAFGAILVAFMLLLPRISLASVLYGAAYDPARGNALFQIDPATGQISPSVFVNNLGLVIPYETNIAFAPNGALYGAAYVPARGNALFQIDPATGQISPSVFVNNLGLVIPYETNIAFAPEANTPIPEPTSGSLLFGALGTLYFYGTARGRRNARQTTLH